MSHDSITLRSMNPGDIPLGMRLKELAGWNQVEGDWRCLLELEPQGCFVAEWNGSAVATATALRYGQRLGWIGMVLVDPPARRRGIATRLVEAAIRYLEEGGCSCQKLDATESGARVYEKMGFQVEYVVERWLREPASPFTPSPGTSLHPVRRLDAVRDLDEEAFGASRQPLLAWYARQPVPQALAGSLEGPCGYVTGRQGSFAWQMGPLVARDESVAAELMSYFTAGASRQPLIADIVGGPAPASRLLSRFGFSRRRVLYRMYRGPNQFPGRPEWTFCLAGFEYG